MGGKYGMGMRILARREAYPTFKVAGLLDGDFPAQWPGPKFEPVSWRSADDAVDFGWRWSRKEIENYLIDPNIVVSALGKDVVFARDFEALIQQGANEIFAYQAARTALSNCRKQFTDLPSTWLPKRLPNDLSPAACLAAIRDVVDQHSAEQAVTVDEVTERFNTLLPEFVGGGARRQDFLWTFSGDDILLACAQRLNDIGFASPRLFKEKILLGIEASEQDVATWLEEWARLKQGVASF
jgi:hypothetical protein